VHGVSAPGIVPAFGICLEEYEYPYPVQFLSLPMDLQPQRMAYMDVPAQKAAHRRTVVVESRRHLLDFGKMAPAESAELGSVLHRLGPAVKLATGAHRLCFRPLMERAPRFHVWIVPKKEGSRLRGVAYLAGRRAPASGPAAASMAKRIRRRFKER